MTRVPQLSALIVPLLVLGLASSAAVTTPPPGFALQEMLSVPSKPQGLR